MKNLWGVARKAATIFDHALDILFAFSGVLLVFATVSVAVGIVTRYFLSRPLAWVTEISEYILLYIAFLAGAWVLKKEEHVKMDIIINYLPSRVKALINFITSVISSMVCLIIAVFGAKVTWGLYESKAFTYTILELPKFVFTSVIFFGAFLLFIQFIRRSYGYLRLLNEKNENAVTK